MGGKLGSKFAAVVIAVSAVAGVAVMAQPSGAAFNPTFRFDFNVDATTHLKKLDQTIVVHGGRFQGAIDFTTATEADPNAKLRGVITLPQTTFTYQAAGIVPLLTATAAIVPTKPVTGFLNLPTLTVTATSTFNIKIISAKINGTNNNLVGNNCQTATPVTVTMSGPASFGGASAFSGEFTLPKLANCGLAQTIALNQVMPGPGNTFSASATPRPAA
jgi:hypothetical protein